MLPKTLTPRLFDRIAPHYDWLNHLFSLGLDLHWRRIAASQLPAQPNLTILDVATGTGDQLFFLKRQALAPVTLLGLDPSPGMLAIAAQKLKRAGLNTQVTLHAGTAEALPFPEHHADVITTSFGIRNFPDPPKALREFYRVLKPGGRAIVLELSIPESSWLKTPYLFYFRRILPWLGGIISGERGAYRYLNQSVERFPQGRDFCLWMEAAGFTRVQAQTLTLGIATVYWGERTA